MGFSRRMPRRDSRKRVSRSVLATGRVLLVMPASAKAKAPAEGCRQVEVNIDFQYYGPIRDRIAKEPVSAGGHQAARQQCKTARLLIGVGPLFREVLRECTDQGIRRHRLETDRRLREV